MAARVEFEEEAGQIAALDIHFVMAAWLDGPDGDGIDLDWAREISAAVAGDAFAGRLTREEVERAIQHCRDFIE